MRDSDDKVAGRVAGLTIVTGAAGSIGSHCARLMVEASWLQLLLCDVDERRLERVAAPLRAAGAGIAMLPGDISDPSFMALLSERIGASEIAALIHTAGIAPHMGAPERVFEVNLDATLRLIETARPIMADGGAAVLVASVAGHLPVSPEAQAAFEQRITPEGSSSIRHFASDSKAAYLLSKRAIIATVKREAKAFAQRNARIVSVSPGLIDTAMTQGLAEPASGGMVNNAAIQRLGRPDEVAAACVFLCSSSASYITGCDLRVDGGALAGLGI